MKCLMFVLLWGTRLFAKEDFRDEISIILGILKAYQDVLAMLSTSLVLGVTL